MNDCPIRILGLPALCRASFLRKSRVSCSPKRTAGLHCHILLLHWDPRDIQDAYLIVLDIIDLLRAEQTMGQVAAKIGPHEKT